MLSDIDLKSNLKEIAHIIINWNLRSKEGGEGQLSKGKVAINKSRRKKFKGYEILNIILKF